MKQRKYTSSSGKYCHGGKGKKKQPQNEQMNLVLKKTVAARQTVSVKSRSVAVIFFLSLCFRSKWEQRKEIYTEQKLTLAPRRTARSHSLKPIFQLRSNWTPSRIIYGLHECCAHGGVWFSLSGEELLELLSLGKRGLMTRGFNKKKKNQNLLRSTQPFSTLKIFFWFSKEATKKSINATLKSACPVSGRVQFWSVRLCYSGCSFSSMSDTRMFFSVCSARLELVRL